MEEKQELPKTIFLPVMETIHEEHKEIAVKEKEKVSKMAEKKEKEEEKEEEEENEEVTAPEEKLAAVSLVVNEKSALPLKESAESTEQSNTTKREEKETDENTGATRQEEGEEKSESVSPKGGTSAGQEETGQQDTANEEVGVVLKEDEQKQSDIAISRYLVSFLFDKHLSFISLSLSLSQASPSVLPLSLPPSISCFSPYPTCYLTHTFLCLLNM